MSFIDDIADALGFHRDVDVQQVLNDRAAAQNQGNLDYGNSIVDLLTVLGLPSDHTYRDQLAAELQVQADPNDSAAFNEKLHEAVMVKLAERGGKVPEEWLPAAC